MFTIDEVAGPVSVGDEPWWRTAVIYQIYPRSFSDSNGDGIGDLPGISARLDHVRRLGADAVWLSPFYPSPQRDGGYDVSDYRNVDSQFGTLADFDHLVTRARELGLRVIVDLVPNHCSADHPAFRSALAAAPDSAEREQFLFRVGRGPGGDLPPNDWVSMFGGPAWTRVRDHGDPGQWYLHLFDSSQPDWNWANPVVLNDFEETLRFWLDRGVDGFRVDVCDALVKADGLPDWPHPVSGVVHEVDGRRPPMWDQEGIHPIFRSWRRLVDSYPGSRILCAEAWLPPERAARIVRPDEMHQAFNFAFLEQRWNAADLRSTITTSLAANDAVGAPTTWVLSNHDVMRHASRYGYDGPVELEAGVGADDPQPDRALGLRRARAATLVMLALPGSAYLYQGEELGLPEVTDLPDDVRQDPVWERTQHSVRGRDGCRVPLPWTTGPGFGFTSGPSTWLPQPDYFGDYAVSVQEHLDDSTLSLYRRALRLRRELDLGGGGALTWSSDDGDQRWASDAEDVLAFRRGPVLVVANLSADPLPLPPGARVLLASRSLTTHVLPVDAAAWLDTPRSGRETSDPGKETR
jgi:alpha-glucosidase